MPGPSILKIKEIFWSFQGEGLRLGQPSIFLRLSGCTLRCPFCDTREAWENGHFLGVAEIIDQIARLSREYPCSQVVITGGEPLEQDLSGLVPALKARNYFICLETNGSLFQELPSDWWTVSPKEGSDYHIHEGLYSRIAEVKLVVTPALDLGVVKGLRERVGEGVPIFLQPESGDKEGYRKTFQLFSACQRSGLPHIRCGLQLHKLYEVK